VRPKTSGHVIGSLIFLAIAAIIDDIAWFAPDMRADGLPSGLTIGIWIVAVTATIGFVWMAYENWFGRM
jgi:hypothetical protein